VDLLGRYSKRANWTSGRPGLRDVTTGPQSRTTRSRRPPARQLTALEVAALVDQYRSGATVYDLADQFSIHRTTVSQHLHRQGIGMRRQGLYDDQVDHAVQLYQTGQSLTRIGARLDVDAGTVHAALRTRGVRMRDPHDRERVAVSEPCDARQDPPGSTATPSKRRRDAHAPSCLSTNSNT
jgi:hypothetical protein